MASGAEEFSRAESGDLKRFPSDDQWLVVQRHPQYFAKNGAVCRETSASKVLLIHCQQSISTKLNPENLVTFYIDKVVGIVARYLCSILKNGRKGIQKKKLVAIARGKTFDALGVGIRNCGFLLCGPGKQLEAGIGGGVSLRFFQLVVLPAFFLGNAGGFRAIFSELAGSQTTREKGRCC